VRGLGYGKAALVGEVVDREGEEAAVTLRR
jgi:hypothetical protein